MPGIRIVGLAIALWAGRLPQPRPPVRFERTPARIGAPAPTIGQHTDEILAEIGLGGEIARLREAGVVA
jgi:crotonobetainyl-CoA:carnitine CoA-transferase CaiB-like acyl-CoA transferase